MKKKRSPESSATVAWYFLKKRTLLPLIMLLSGLPALAQHTLRGMVTDSLGAPISGVSVLLKSTTHGTQTSTDGHFTLNIPQPTPNGVLVFSGVGYSRKEILIGNQTMFNVVLSLAQTTLNDVVVVGYGTQRKAHVTGAVSSISSDELEGKAVPNVTQALQGVAPNLIIQQNATEPGAALNVNIRGVGTLGNSSALVIIDGIPGSLNNLNPNDIDNISILKDAASAAIYGARAANGVILVTTKKGKKGSRQQVNYNGILGIQSPLYMVKPVSAYEYVVLKNEALINSGLPPAYTPEQIREVYERGSYTPWLDEIIRKNASQQNHNLAVSGSSGATSYLFSGGYVDQRSLYKGSDYGLKRYNLRANINSQIGSRLKLGSVLGLSRTAIREHAYYSEWLISTAARIPRLYPIKDSAGSYTIAPTASNNPLAQLEKGGLREYQNDNLNFNLNAELALVKGLSLKAVYGGDLSKNVLNEFRKSIDYAPYVGSDNQSSYTDGLTNISLTNLQAMLNYETRFADEHRAKALLGYSTESYRISNFQLRKLNVDNNTGLPVTGTTIDESGSYNRRTDRWALNSLFGRVNYDFAGKYLVEFNFRLDASSRFAEDNRQAFFPSISAGWKITDEKIFENIRDKFGDVKLRGSWGQLGNQEIGLYQYLNSWVTNPNVYGFNNQGQAGSSFSVGNRDIRWETSTMTNIGVDASLLNNKLTISYDYFVKNTSGILLNLPAPNLYGATPPIQNAGKVKNQGWEIAISYKAKTGDVAHIISVNLADNYNTVTDIKGQTFITEADRTFIIREGFPINSYYGLQSDGFYQSYDEISKSIIPSFVNSVQPGDIKYVDRNKDGRIDNNDRYIMGNPFPRYTFGFNYSATWKGFSLNLLVQGVGKRALYIRGEGVEAFHNNWDNLYQQHLDRWTPTHPNASYPRLTIGSASTNNIVGSDFWLLNAAYARLKNVQLGYSFNNHILEKWRIAGLMIYITGQNLFTITKMNNGFDPELNELNNSLQISNTHANSGRVYPNMRVLAAGLNVSF
jgi:TonB-linked outer membrane protein, SusC/RagA family